MISIIIINIGKDKITPHTLNKLPNIIIVIIYSVWGISLLSLYILGVIKYASIWGIIIDINDVNINTFLLITDAVIIAIIFVNIDPIKGINVFNELSNPSNK